MSLILDEIFPFSSFLFALPHLPDIFAMRDSLSLREISAFISELHCTLPQKVSYIQNAKRSYGPFGCAGISFIAVRAYKLQQYGEIKQV